MTPLFALDPLKMKSEFIVQLKHQDIGGCWSGGNVNLLGVDVLEVLAVIASTASPECAIYKSRSCKFKILRYIHVHVRK